MKNRKTLWIKWIALSVCLCLVIVGSVALGQRNAPGGSDSSGIAAFEPESKKESSELPPDISQPDSGGVTIPEMEVSLAANEMADMIGFFIYEGRCYVHYDWISDTNLMGEYLGTATGLIDEWTPKDGYVNFAGSVQGDFYSVKGYDPAFMLCLEIPTGFLGTYICDNGITLNYGSELFEDRLHLSDNLESVQYESRDSWFYSKGERFQMKSISDGILDFIAAMDSARFMLCDSVPLPKGTEFLSETELYHLYFQTKNGMTVHLRLHENGYVTFDGMRMLCVQIPEESYRELLGLLDSRTDSAILADPKVAVTSLEDCLNDRELGKYVPTCTPEGYEFNGGNIYYYLDELTADAVGTEHMWLDYRNLETPGIYYSISIMRKEELEQNRWDGPSIDASDLSVEKLWEYDKTETLESEDGTLFSKLMCYLGVWHGDVCTIISAHGMEAETLYEILSSIE